MIPEPVFDLIIPLCFMAALVLAASWSILKAFQTGTIRFGYKYYPPGHTCRREEDPGGFWFGIGLYIFCISVVVFMTIFILTR